MVDFNNETTITKSSEEIMRFVVVEEHVNVNEMLKFYREKKSEGINHSTSKLQGRIFGLFNLLQPMIKRRFSKEQYEELQKMIASQKYDDLYKAYTIINELLDSIGLTRMDTKTPLGGNIIERNRAHGVPV